ncbi:tumor protein p53-inducible nuclear protein 2 isoform X1 [Protopterus annectens]|uniref:tumor protein p53-inducible nuclear protein 2 isoform X1 n=1 Tax=Protopterus annectens TaxID=7888 RepID=UPI001CFB5E2C|nr:tumor protein p53-inducible nuclear protein 2 isoform X1 [Protopterus annectens]XP_043946218.1 tumor protein p53-inducible nuclear protein 2 isoform X1 [Protopterus annectens]
MFQQFTSFLFGVSSPDCDEEPTIPSPSISEKEDDGWLIIDFPDSCTLNSSEGEHADERDVASAPNANGPSPASSLDTLSDCDLRSMPLQPTNPCLMDESWFVTPPPCFTAEDQEAVKLESSPLENLLIEHPSMSVYVTSTVENDATTETATERDVAQNRMERHAPRHTASVNVHAGVLQKLTEVHRIQRVKIWVERRKLSQNRIHRQNLVRECRPRKALHQRSFVYQPCQRIYNH